MKKLLGRANTYSLILDIACIFCFFAPFIMLKGTITTVNIVYVSGFDLAFGSKVFSGISIPVLCMFIFICVAIILNLFAYKHRSLSWINFILECGTAVLMFCILSLYPYGFSISPSSYVASVHAGSMVDGSLLIIACLCSFANAVSTFKRKPEEIKN